MSLFTRHIDIVLAVAITMAASIAAFAQRDPVAPKAKPAPPSVIQVGIPGGVTAPVQFGFGNSESSIKVDPRINMSLCVTQGSLKVNGWNRDEVRVFVSGGSSVGFRIQQKNPKTGDPVWIMITTDDKVKGKYGPVNECLNGSEIEIDAPVNAALSLKGQEITTNVDGIRRVSIKNVGGGISLRNISDGVSATSYRGDLTVEQSTGAIMLENTTGNILVFDVGPSEIGDIFKAKTTNGSISVQKIGHRQLEVNSITGTVAYNGEILNGGSYNFGTSNGSIRLSLPSSVACRLSASYGFGSFSSDIPYELETENVSPGPVKSIVAKMGKGGSATLNLTTNNGSISIKKQQ